MPDFGFITADTQLTVTIRGNHYPVIKTGKGRPCLLICLGTPSFRTLSKKFTEHFEVYSSDMYWISNYELADINSVTIDTIIDDIKALGDALNLQKYLIFGHSAYGIIALEFAKKYPDVAAGILMIGTPINANVNVARQNNAIFQSLADEHRKAIDSARREKIAEKDLTKLTSAQRWREEYIYRDAPRYWHIPDFDCTELWEEINLSKLFIKLFDEILPKIDVLKNLEKITVPVLLAAGMSDYDCCPWLWDEVSNLPKNFSIRVFNQSGHWPHYEEAELFDNSVIEWAKQYLT